MAKILRKDGWELNPNDKIVNSILGRIEKNNGECPCVNPGKTLEDRLCPCKEYRENNTCHCGLYVRKEKTPTYRCFACGGELIWENDWMKSELFGCDEDEDSVVNVLHCKDCGAEVYVVQATEDKVSDEN